jgi:hypothetical protein
MVEKDRTTAIVDHKVDLTKSELLDLGARFGQLDLDEDALHTELKSITASYKAKIADIHTEMKEIAMCIRTKKRTLTSECVVQHNYTDGIVEYLHVESGAILKTRKMTPDELQLKLFGGE